MKQIKMILAVIISVMLTGCAVEITENSNTEGDTSSTITGTVAESDSSITISSDVTASEIWNPAVIQRQVLVDEGCICGVALVGYVDGEASVSDCRKLLQSSVYSDTIPDLMAIPDSNIIDTGYANELYLIIPTDVEASVAVNEFVFSEENDFIGTAGEVLYSSEYGSPILIKCNFSDIMPNTIVNIVDSEGNVLSWSPYISLKDGSVGIVDGVYDFTEYQ